MNKLIGQIGIIGVIIILAISFANSKTTTTTVKLPKEPKTKGYITYSEDCEEIYTLANGYNTTITTIRWTNGVPTIRVYKANAN